MATYALRADIEAIFGTKNVLQWGDLDNTGISADITARITASLDWATDFIDGKLADGPITLPVARAVDGLVPPLIVDACARLAGIHLYEARAAEDTSDEQNRPRDARMADRKRVASILEGIRHGTIRLSGVTQTSKDFPQVVKT